LSIGKRKKYGEGGYIMDTIVKLKEYIGDGKRSQSEFAKHAGISQVSISRILRGEQKNLTAATIAKIEGTLKKLKNDGNNGGNMEKDVLELLRGLVNDLRKDKERLEKENDRLRDEIRTLRNLNGRRKNDKHTAKSNEGSGR